MFLKIEDGKVLTSAQLAMDTLKFSKVDLSKMDRKDTAGFIGVSYMMFEYGSTVSCQSANGQFNENVFNFFQNKGGVHSQNANNLPPVIWNTLVAVWILTNQFSSDKNKWKLVVNKAKKFLSTQLKVDIKEVTKMIEQLNLNEYCY